MSIGKKNIRTAFGALALSAFVSVAFNAYEAMGDEELPPQLETSDQLNLSAPIEVLGTYVVSDIAKTNRGKKIRTCSSTGPVDPKALDPRCGAMVWIVRLGKQVAFLKSESLKTGSEPTVHASIMDGGQCDTAMPLSEVQDTLFTSSKLCRGTLNHAFAVRGSDSYLFNESLNPKGPLADKRAEAHSYRTFGGILGLAVASDIIIHIPKNERSPKTIQITEVVAGTETLIFWPTNVSWRNTMKLTYVGQ